MKNLVIGIVAFIVLLSGCTGVLTPVIESPIVGSGPVVTAPLTVSIASTDDAIAGPSMSVVGGSDEVSVSWRSSDIEFWSTTAAGGYEGLVSSKYIEMRGMDVEDPSLVSVEVNLPDASETFMFERNHTTLSTGEETIFQSVFYDIVRVDVGAGFFTFRHNGEMVTVVNTVTGDMNGINGNSIFLIDSDLLSNYEYVPRTEFYDYDNLVDNHGQFIADFIMMNPEIDMDGALFIPFDGINLTNLNEHNGGNLTIHFNWRLQNSFDDIDGDGVYEMDNRVNGTPFDFRIHISMG